MPDFHHLLLFIAAGLLLNLTPGPDVMFIVANAVRAGARAGVAAALGISAGCLVHVAAAALGVSALLAAVKAALPSGAFAQGTGPEVKGTRLGYIALTDNIVSFATARYRNNPLIVQGPGAGPEVTAGGICGDLLRLSAYLGARL